MEKHQKTGDKNQHRIKQEVRFVTIDKNHLGQRIDNFLMSQIREIPRSFVYRILRKGEVRINKKRAKPTQKLQLDDVVRIPPIYLSPAIEKPQISSKQLDIIKNAILFEDDSLIFINKPSGLAVHGGSGVNYGLIEAFRLLRPEIPFIELVHRLDKDTSGIVMLAKSRQVLLEMHEKLQNKGLTKIYQALVLGRWKSGELKVENRLKKVSGKKQKVKVVSDNEQSAKLSESIFYPEYVFDHYSLLNVKILTGRMHQIRTQLADKGYPVLGDSKYGNFNANRQVKKDLGLKRLFLHARQIKFTLESTQKDYDIKVPLAKELQNVIDKLKTQIN